MVSCAIGRRESSGNVREIPDGSGKFGKMTANSLKTSVPWAGKCSGNSRQKPNFPKKGGSLGRPLRERDGKRLGRRTRHPKTPPHFNHQKGDHMDPMDREIDQALAERILQLSSGVDPLLA